MAELTHLRGSQLNRSAYSSNKSVHGEALFNFILPLIIGVFLSPLLFNSRLLSSILEAWFSFIVGARELLEPWARKAEFYHVISDRSRVPPYSKWNSSVLAQYSSWSSKPMTFVPAGYDES